MKSHITYIKQNRKQHQTKSNKTQIVTATKDNQTREAEINGYGG